MRTIQQLMSLENRRALVVGGAGHVGRTAVAALKELGASVAIADVAEPREAMGADHFVPMDLRDVDKTRAGLQQAVKILGGIDILVHSAALVGTSELTGWAEPFEQQSVEAWDAALRINLTSAFVLVQEARAALAQSGHGSVIFIGSIYGALGPDYSLYEGTAMQNPVGYGACKGGLLQLTRYFSCLLAPEVRVNMLSPGGIARGQPAAFVEKYEKRTPLRRMATEEDLKGGIAYLASGLSAYVTGQHLLVDGGWSAW
jgi:NAD(P)-dependent dehydrogenase (short-subunit alcohol dehydrogenase family)